MPPARPKATAKLFSACRFKLRSTLCDAPGRPFDHPLQVRAWLACSRPGHALLGQLVVGVAHRLGAWTRVPSLPSGRPAVRTARRTSCRHTPDSDTIDIDGHDFPGRGRLRDVQHQPRWSAWSTTWPRSSPTGREIEIRVETILLRTGRPDDPVGLSARASSGSAEADRELGASTARRSVLARGPRRRQRV
jgi:hypothetical protein